MSLDHILLGMLRTPASGYDVKRGFSEGTRHFWSAELSQIYPALKKLEERGWLASRLQPPAKGPPRRVYHRTAEGLAELIRWLSSGPRMGTERFAYLAQLCFMHEIDDLEATSDFMLELRSRLIGFLALLQQAESDCAGIDSERRDNPQRRRISRLSGRAHGGALPAGQGRLVRRSAGAYRAPPATPRSHRRGSNERSAGATPWLRRFVTCFAGCTSQPGSSAWLPSGSPPLARKGGRLHVAAGRVFGGCGYVVALTALGSTSWALLHPSGWAGQGWRPVSLVEVPADEIMVIAILGFLALLLLGGVETGFRAMRDAPPARPVCRVAPAAHQLGAGRGKPGAVRLRPLPRSPERRPLLDPHGAGGRRYGRLLRRSSVLRQSPPNADGVVVQAHGGNGRVRHRLSHCVSGLRLAGSVRRGPNPGHVVVSAVDSAGCHWDFGAAGMDTLLQAEVRRAAGADSPRISGTRC